MSPTKKVYISPDAATQVLKNPLLPADRSARIRSRLFKGDPFLQALLLNRYTLSAADLNLIGNFHKTVQKIQIALRIVLPEVAPSVDAPDLFCALQNRLDTDGLFGSVTDEYIRLYQQYKNLTINGIIGHETVNSLDQDLHDIYYYDLVKMKAIHNKKKSVACGYFTVTSIDGDASMYDEPQVPNSPAANQNLPLCKRTTSNLLRKLPFGTRVRIIEIYSDWCYVEVLVDNKYVVNGEIITYTTTAEYSQYNPAYHNAVVRGEAKINNEPDEVVSYNLVEDDVISIEGVQVLLSKSDFINTEEGVFVKSRAAKIFFRGYIRRASLWTNSRMPDPQAELYKIMPGDTISAIVLQKYAAALTPYDDDEARFFWCAIIFANNPSGAESYTQFQLNKDTGAYDLQHTVTDAPIYHEPSVITAKSWYSILNNPSTTSPTISSIIMADESRTWLDIATRLAGLKGGGLLNPGEFKLRASGSGQNYYMWLPGVDNCIYMKKAIDSKFDYDNYSDIIYHYFENTIVGATLLTLKQWLDKGMPVGSGVELEGSVGLTFGLPLAADGSAKVMFKRTKERVFELTRTGTLAVGVDAEIGWGYFLGLGKKKKNLSVTPHEMYGLGGNIGLQAHGGMKLSISDTFEFDLDRGDGDHVLAKMLIAAGGLDIPIMAGKVLDRIAFGSSFVQMFHPYNLDPSDYRKVLRIENELYEEAGAGATAGLKIGDSDTKSWWEDEDSKQNHEKGKVTEPKTLLGFLSVSLGINVGTELGSGVELEFNDGWRKDDELGYFWVPNKIKLSLFNSGTLSASIAGQFGPYGLATTDLLPGFPSGFLIERQNKISFMYTWNDSDFNERHILDLPGKFEYLENSTLLKVGESDENYWEIECVLDHKNKTSIANSSDLVDAMQKLKLTKRVGLGAAFGTLAKYPLLDKLRTKVKDTAVKYSGGLMAEGYVEFEFENDHAAIQLLKPKLQIIAEYLYGLFPPDPWAAMLYGFLEVLKPKDINSIDDKDVIAAMRELNKSLGNPQAKCRWHAEFGVAGGVGAKVGVGEFKGRVSVSAALTIIFEKDASADFQAELENGSELVDDIVNNTYETDANTALLPNPQQGLDNDWFTEVHSVTIKITP